MSPPVVTLSTSSEWALTELSVLTATMVPVISSPATAPRLDTPTDGGPATLDIVLPVFNEAAVVEASVRRLHSYLSKEFPLSWSITVADNASTDATGAIADGLATQLPNVRVCHLSGKGRGLALRHAWTTSISPIVAYMDIDLSTDLDALLPMIAPLLSEHSEIAIGSRLSAGARVARGPKRELISRCYNLGLRALFATQIRDMQCGFKAIRADVARELLDAIEDDAWFFDTELLLLAEHNGLRIHQVPVDWTDDADSQVDIRATAAGDVRGALRLARSFLAGRGRIEVREAHPPPRDDFGRRLVAFGTIGIFSTVASLVIFLLLRPAFGAIGANLAAVSTLFVANTWLNARFTWRRARPRWLRAIGVLAAALVLTSAALVGIHAVGGGLIAEIGVLCVTWPLAGIARFLTLAHDR